jgi:hypothetical protein
LGIQTVASLVCLLPNLFAYYPHFLNDWQQALQLHVPYCLSYSRMLFHQEDDVATSCDELKALMDSAELAKKLRRRQSDARWRANLASCYDTLKLIIPLNARATRKQVSKV